MVKMSETLTLFHNNANPENRKLPVPLEKTRLGALTANAKGASIRRGRFLSDDNPLKLQLSDCESCPIKQSCSKFMRGAKCFFEIQKLKTGTQKNDFLVKGDPRKLLEDLQVTVNKLEESMNFDGNPKKSDLKELINLKIQLFQIVHGKPKTIVQQNMQINSESEQIKSLMKELRAKQQAEEVVTILKI